MSTPNIGWLYFKDYHQTNSDQVSFFMYAPSQKGDQRDDYFQHHYERKNTVILGKSFDATNSNHLQVVSPVENLQLKTIYPGLTLGSGYTHETGELGEFKLGFFFDYSTGYPCIPGSTVKGCLRGMFPQKERKEVADKNEKYHYLASVIRELPNLKEGYILENDLREEFDQKESSRRKQFIDILEREIFDGEKPERDENGTPKKKDEKIIYKPNCVYERDIFFDGYIVSTNHPAINRSVYQNPKPFIGDDYITPHQNRKKPEMSPFTNPIPLMFLKILPEVTIQFQFDVKNGLLTKEQKEELFRRLLLDFGIGAKTNVGYGQFDDEVVKPFKKLPDPILSIPKDIVPLNAIPFLKKESKFQGEMIDQIGLFNIYKFKVGKEECRLKKGTDRNPDFKVGNTVTIHFKQDYKIGSPNFHVLPGILNL
ncbi:MAG: type III-B CRISPR module RAMP protein Cmr6 [Ignavibacteria bacterium]|nr:type III-B CRISPR module RAMP protein Cmr6 [Ignavibacteria bacterium]